MPGRRPVLVSVPVPVSVMMMMLLQGAGGWSGAGAVQGAKAGQGLGRCRWLVQVAGAGGWCRWRVPVVQVNDVTGTSRTGSWARPSACASAARRGTTRFGSPETRRARHARAGDRDRADGLLQVDSPNDIGRQGASLDEGAEDVCLAQLVAPARHARACPATWGGGGG